jgi:hypothetical protein
VSLLVEVHVGGHVARERDAAEDHHEPQHAAGEDHGQDQADHAAGDEPHHLARDHPVDGPARRVARDVELDPVALTGVGADEATSETQGGRPRRREHPLLEGLVEVLGQLARRVGHRLEHRERAVEAARLAGAHGLTDDDDREQDQDPAHHQQDGHLTPPP